MLLQENTWRMMCAPAGGSQKRRQAAGDWKHPLLEPQKAQHQQLCQLHYDPSLAGGSILVVVTQWSMRLCLLRFRVWFLFPLIACKKYFILLTGKQIKKITLSDNLDAG